MDKVLNANSFDWALIHLTRYCDNDLFPPLFEFELIANNWQQARTKSLGIDLETYTARPFLARYAPDSAGSFRVVYRLDPLDAMMYTAIVHEIQGGMRTAARDACSKVAGSLTVEPAADGSFFGNWQDAWKSHTEKLETLAGEYAGSDAKSADGYALAADLQDLFSYIQPHRFVYKLINANALPSGRARILGRALFALFPSPGKGIPMGMAASTVLTEMILEEVDARMLQCTPDYTRWGSGIYAFFQSKQEAREALRDLSSFLLTAHSMTLVPERTRIVQAREMRVDKTTDAGLAEQRMNAVIGRNPYTEPQHGWRNSPLGPLLPDDAHQIIRRLPEYQSAETAYQVRFSRAVSANPPDLATSSSILRKAGVYGITTILPDIFEHFQKLTPAIRDVTLYLKNVLNRENVHAYASDIQNAWVRTRHLGEYIHDWWCHMLTGSCFNEIDLPADIDEIVGIRNQALIALRKKDSEWVRRNSVHLEDLDLWDRRAVLCACSILSSVERTRAAGTVRRGISEQSVARHITASAEAPVAKARPRGLERLSIAFFPPTTEADLPPIPLPDIPPIAGQIFEPTTTLDPPFPLPDIPPIAGQIMATPDSYPGYGDKAVQPSPRWLMERVPELDALLRNHGSEIMVSFQDSVDSGNCISGTEAYRREILARLRLPSKTLEVQASALLGDRDDPLVRRAARAAALRWASLHPGATGSGS